MKFVIDVSVTTSVEVEIEADSLEAAQELAKDKAAEEASDFDAEHFTADILGVARRCSDCGDDNVLEEGTYEGLCVNCAKEAHKEDEADHRRDY